MSNVKKNTNSFMVVADRMLAGEFGVYGRGDFDLSVEELAEVLKIAITSGSKAESRELLGKYFEEIR